MDPRKHITTLCWLLLLVLLSPLTGTAQTPPAPSKTSFSISGHTFRIAAVAFDETAMGFVPPDMGPDEQALFVEFELFAGDEENFKDMEMEVSCDPGQKIKPILLTADGVVKMLATVTIKATSGFYQPKSHYIAWVYIVPREAKKFQLNFPDGRVYDLSPLIKKKIHEIYQPGLFADRG